MLLTDMVDVGVLSIGFIALAGFLVVLLATLGAWIDGK